ncbi:hypothetical protein QQS21_011271 [Conoideocrella luteorostrata]|uniref:Protein kinase domain-containing protein n=1 Tax=Conoideocrella luteorostrata TaxID=1105319 RepID=A0AAJ0CDJ9_9HYPO|nr:hypothetical protein QQS21_011271 [Conoideocrella luteorostrata]
MDASETNTGTLSFCMLELSVHGDDVVYVFLYNGVRFFVTVAAKDLEGEGDNLRHFCNLREDPDDPDNMFLFEEWVLGALDGFIREVAPNPAPGSVKIITLLEYFSPSTFAFKLVNNAGHLCAVQECYDPDIHGDITPRTQIVDSLVDFPGSDRIEPEEVILRTTLPPVPIISAACLELCSDELLPEELSDIPKRVRRAGTSEVFFFKGGFKDHGHQRELKILTQIHCSRSFEQPLPTSRLAGLVVWDDDASCLMGFLLEYIEGETLALRAETASLTNKIKWMRQVEATVKQLHQLNVVWGDVKSDNVIINTSGDAVIVDFGGGYTPGFIEKELQQTARGDLMGLDHMAAEMGFDNSSNT